MAVTTEQLLKLIKNQKASLSESNNQPKFDFRRIYSFDDDEESYDSDCYSLYGSEFCLTPKDHELLRKSRLSSNSVSQCCSRVGLPKHVAQLLLKRAYDMDDVKRYCAMLSTIALNPDYRKSTRDTNGYRIRIRSSGEVYNNTYIDVNGKNIFHLSETPVSSYEYKILHMDPSIISPDDYDDMLCAIYKALRA